VVESRYASMRSRSQPALLSFLAQGAGGRSFCYSNAGIRKVEESEEVFRFIDFWRELHKRALPRHLVFDSELTTYANLARLDEMEVSFMTLRRRSSQLPREIAPLPRSAWRAIELDVPTSKYRTPRIYEQKAPLAGRTFRQDLGHEEPKFLLTNRMRTPVSRAHLPILIASGLFHQQVQVSWWDSSPSATFRPFASAQTESTFSLASQTAGPSRLPIPGETESRL